MPGLPSRRTTLGLLGGGTLTALVSACAGGGGRPLRIGFQKNGVLFVAKQRGSLDAAVKAAGAPRIAWSEFASGPPLLEALSAGAVDFGVTGDTPPVYAQAAGGALQYVAAVPLSGAAAAILVRKDSPFKSLAELKGKSLAYANGSSAQAFADAALRAVGLTLADVKSVNLGPADGAAALARGDVDAWIIWDPYYALAELQYGARPLVTATGATRSYQFYLGNKGYLAANAPVAKALLDALKAEGAWAKAHPAEVAKIMSQATGLPEAVQLRVAQRQDYDLRPIDAQTIADQQILADRLLSQKVIPKPVKVSDAVWTGWA